MSVNVWLLFVLKSRSYILNTDDKLKLHFIKLIFILQDIKLNTNDYTGSKF